MEKHPGLMDWRLNIAKIEKCEIKDCGVTGETKASS